VADRKCLVITNVRLVDGGRLSPRTAVTVENGLIATVGDHAARPAGSLLADGEGCVLLPGLIDAHVHLDGPDRLDLLAGYGVTTALDMASLPEETSALRGRPGTTDIRSAGIPAIAPGSLHAHFPGVGPRGLIGGPDEAHKFVADRIAEGSDYIKIVIGSPLADHEQATIDALVAAAHEAGKLVVAHASSVASVAKAQLAGADILTHAPLDGVLPAAAARLARAAGRVVIPTLTMMAGIVASIAPPGADYAHARASVAELHAAGVPVLAGTDANQGAGSPSPVAHGPGLHDELALLVDAGLTAAEALDAATSRPATYFGLTDRGTMESGKRADLVLATRSPTSGPPARSAACGAAESSTM
jgi:imidazolonepropionase-like amidohydrolase